MEPDFFKDNFSLSRKSFVVVLDMVVVICSFVCFLLIFAF